MSEAEVSQFLCVLIKMGEALQNSGAEVFRVEDTLNRIAAAYGAEEVNIFVITSSIVVTLTMPDLPPQTQTRRLRKSTGNDLLELEQLNALSRRICAEKPPVEEFQQQLSTILAQPGEPRLHLAGSVLAAASFAVFFGGSLWDGVLAGGVAVFICWMERWLAPFCLNGVAFQFIASFLSGMAALLCCRVCPVLHADMVLIGVIMLLVPGIPFTNAIRDILLGDIISGSLRLVEARSAGGHAGAWHDGSHLADGRCRMMQTIIQLLSGALGSIGFGLLFHLNRRYLPAAGVGGLLAWLAYLLAAPAVHGTFLANLMGGVCAALYAEFMARWYNAPSTPFFITAAVPLIPGSTLYYCMNAVVSSNLLAAEHYGEQTFLAAFGIAGGMAIAWCLADLSRKLNALLTGHNPAK